MNDADRRRLTEAAKQFKSTRKELQQWKRKNARKLDPLFHDAHDVVFAETDCLTCANCCKTTSPIFRDVDIERLARHLRLKPGQLIEEYLHLDEEGHYVLNQSPCVFLEDDNTCRVYEHRPQACREYPHTNRKNMHQIMDLTARNTLVCPAVNRILDQVRKELS